MEDSSALHDLSISGRTAKHVSDPESVELFKIPLSPHILHDNLSRIYDAGAYNSADNDVRSTHGSLSTSDNKSTPLTLFQRIGPYLILVNIGALILLLGCESALAFLWFGNNSDDRWRFVMVDGWIGQAVTLSTVAIRLCVTTQAGTATAMLASVSIESLRYGGVTLSDGPALSLARYTNSGPLMTFPTFLRNARFVKRRLLACVTFSLALITLVSQFTSTLLLWDVRPHVVPESTQSRNVTTGITMDTFTHRFGLSARTAQNYWTSSPGNYPVYAEGKGSVLSSPESVSDTAATIRAFLPYTSESERTMLKEFSGVTAAFDARVACVRPVISDWSFNSITGNSTTYNPLEDHTMLKGLIRPTNLSTELEAVLRYNQTNPDIAFQCFIDDMEGTIGVKICGLSPSAGGLINSLDPRTNGTLSYELQYHPGTRYGPWWWYASDEYSDDTWQVDLGHAFLVLYTSPNATTGTAFQVQNTTVNHFMLQDRDSWVDFIDTDNKFPDSDNGKLSVTLCYDAIPNIVGDSRVMGVQNYPINATRSSNGSEPSLGWDRAVTDYNTTSIRTQLGAVKGSTDDYHNFHIDITKVLYEVQQMAATWSPTVIGGIAADDNREVIWYPYSPEQVATAKEAHNNNDFGGATTGFFQQPFDFLGGLIWWPITGELSQYEIYALGENVTVPDYSSYNISQTSLHPSVMAIFRDTLFDTDNPALAWQALTTSIFRSAYYDWLPLFDREESTTTRSLVLCQVPLYTKGFTVVMVNLVLHLLLVAAITAWFARETRYSLLNNAWQVVAQLTGPETKMIVDSSTMSDDKTILHLIQDKGQSRRRLRVTETFDSERVYLA